MTEKRYIVDLNTEEQAELKELVSKGKGSARKLTRARILLRADEGWTDAQIVGALDTSISTVQRIRRRFVAGGLPKALNDDPRPGARRKLDGRVEAHLIAITSSNPPDDHDHWTVRLLADKLVERGLVESISHETVRQALKKTC